MKKFSYLILFAFVVIPCKSNSQSDSIKETLNNIIKAVKENNVNDFKNLMGMEFVYMGKSEQMVNGDFKECNYFYNIYLKNNRLKIETIEGYNRMGQKRISLTIFDGDDSVHDMRHVELDIYFGPRNLIPLNKISGYKLIIERLNTNLIPINTNLIPPGKANGS